MSDKDAVRQRVLQEEAVTVLDPLGDLDQDYGSAVIHYGWNLNADTKARTLLFCWIELLPVEVPAPEDDYDERGRSTLRLGGGSKNRVYARHDVVPARDALTWYLSCRSAAHVPFPTVQSAPPDGLASSSEGTKRLLLQQMAEEPRWPELLAASDLHVLPFVPYHIEYPRVHQMLAATPLVLDALWTEGEQVRAVEWLATRLHFDLRRYPEYWGSIHLVAPNPVFRHLESRCEPHSDGAESILLRFHLRHGKSVAGLELSVREEDEWGTRTFARVAIRQPLVRIRFNRAVEAHRFEVVDPVRGVLRSMRNVLTFCKQVGINIHLARTEIVRLDDESFEVGRTGGFTTGGLIGKPAAISPARRQIVAAYYSRQSRAIAEAQDQRWFRGQQDEARAVLRGLLNQAQTEVLLIDPYFGGADLARFTLAVGRDSVPIRVLTSAKALKDSKGDPTNREEGDRLEHILNQILGASRRSNPYEIRVMPGDKAAIHDRFLRIDQKVWLIGSSFNEFGSRGTMMLGLPHPTEVLPDLEREWAEAKPFPDWLRERRASRVVPGDVLW